MLEELNKEIDGVKETIEVLPKVKKADILKYKEFLNQNIGKYNEKLNEVKDEILRRYNKLLSIESAPSLKKEETEIDTHLILSLSNLSDSLSKMGLDVKLYKLKHYYEINLIEVNDIIREIIKAFSDVNVKLTIDDFNYSKYVKDYITPFFDNKINNDKVFEVFDNIFWACPDVIQQVRLNFYNIYFKYKKNIDKFYQQNNKDKSLNEYVETYMTYKEKLDLLKHRDKRFIIDRFLNQDLIGKDFEEASISKLTGKYLKDVNNESNYDNLSKLLSDLNEYKEFLKYIKIIDKFKELYNEKNTFKDIAKKKISEISKKEKELFKINDKLNKKGMFKVKENKRESLLLKIDTLIGELQTLYDEYEDLKIKEEIFVHVTDDTKLPDLFKIACSNFKFVYNVYKENSEDITIDEIENIIKDLNKFLYERRLNIIANISIIDEYDIPMYIMDRFGLLNIMIDAESISEDTIGGTIKDIDNLITLYDIKNLKIDVKDILYILECKKQFF